MPPHDMHILFYTILLAMISPCRSHAEELISDVLTFNPPAFLSARPSFQAGTNSESAPRTIWRYAATDNDPRTSQRLLTISLREMGTRMDSAPAVTSLQSDDPVLKAEMQVAMNSTPNVIPVSPVTNAVIAGQPAWLATCEIPRPYWQKPNNEFFPCEVYWVKVQSNRVAEIKLIADSPEHLQTLKTCLPGFKIKKPDLSPETETADVTH
jgi:hypothetical protein